MKRYLAILAILISCTPKNPPSKMRNANALINETSPYLLQHAYNPVDWKPWSADLLKLAKSQDKLLLISIGYSSCHWCHVMEHESFEDTIVANLMNENFINVKVDREEFPDIDHYYMTAVQLMTGSGGWPLNVIALPDGRPVWGGTYFPKDNWFENLKEIAIIYESSPEKMRDYANKLSAGIQQSELIEPVQSEQVLSAEQKAEILDKWSASFDRRFGGYNRAPKFPLPNNWLYLLNEGIRSSNKQLLTQVELTLDEMAAGGIYDQVGGGFARYSTDIYWKAPHFEKMLYDNAQLISLYSQAYRHFKKARYQEIVSETIDFLQREMKDASGLYHAALDADSEGEEGKFYVWTEQELQKSLDEKGFQIVKHLYGIEPKNKWEGNYILHEVQTREKTATQLGISLQELAGGLQEIKQKLLQERGNRIRPGLDSKCLSAWNAMLLTAFVDAYLAFGDEQYYQLASELFISMQQHYFKDGNYHHALTDGKLKRTALFDDISLSLEAFLAWFRISSDPEALQSMESLMQLAEADFYDEDLSYYAYRPLKEESHLTKHFERKDNVIPGANSVMAKFLFQYSRIIAKPDLEKRAMIMLSGVQSDMQEYPQGHSNWMELSAWQATFSEVIISGAKSKELLSALAKNALVSTLILRSDKDSELSIFKNRFIENETLIYVCENKSCRLPTSNVKQALELWTDIIKLP